ncbi:MAG: chemotaxis response regulator protein-glutamate methylesterase [Verrucomicrobiae bacterium]|nr:chemotaxis response regulator protein-glutamate methylesterase [Verrucomicrobiae bacterium]
MIVDDSVVVRQVVSQALAQDPDVEVLGVAANGKIALARLPQLNPDIVILDIEMPEMDGLTTLREIRKLYPKLPVIMFSTLTEFGASATVQALTLGANDYVHKPSGAETISEGLRQAREAIVPKLKALVPARRAAAAPAAATPAPALPMNLSSLAGSQGHKVEALVIGASTGGPNALAVLLGGLPRNLPVPLLIVQHMPPMFTRMLATHLTAHCGIPVAEAGEGAPVQAGHGLVAPGNYHLTLARHNGDVVAHLNQDPPENSCRPSVDVLFRAAAAVYGRGTLAVVLTGMGQDGLRGGREIREAGGTVLAQDEASSVVWGMPGAVVKAGVAEAVRPLDELALLITQKLQVGRTAWQPQHLTPAARTAAVV